MPKAETGKWASVNLVSADAPKYKSQDGRMYGGARACTQSKLLIISPLYDKLKDFCCL